MNKFIDEEHAYPVFFISPQSSGKSTLINALVGDNVAYTHRNIVEGQQVGIYRSIIGDYKFDYIDIPADKTKEEMAEIISSYPEGLIIFVTLCHCLLVEEEYLKKIIDIKKCNSKFKFLSVYNYRTDSDFRSYISDQKSSFEYMLDIIGFYDPKTIMIDLLRAAELRKKDVLKVTELKTEIVKQIQVKL